MIGVIAGLAHSTSAGQGSSTVLQQATARVENANPEPVELSVRTAPVSKETNRLLNRAGIIGLRRSRKVNSAAFAEVEIVLTEEFGPSDAYALPMAPGGDLEVLENSGRVKVQIPAGEVKALIDKGLEITVLRRFVLVEGFADKTEDSSGGLTTLGSCSGPYIHSESGLNVPIPTDGSWAGSGMEITDAPPGAPVACVDVGYKIHHYYWSWLTVELSDSDYYFTHTLFDEWYDGGYIYEVKTGITTFNGRPVNQSWVLWAADSLGSGPGYIDYWWIKLYYYDSPYCYASGGCYEYISKVQVGTIDNSSGCDDGYADYTDQATEMQIGTGYPITVTNGYYYPDDQCSIWVDWNQDYDFEDSGEQIVASGGPEVFTANITPPGGAASGDTCMRIRIWYEGSPNPCGSTEYGEVEDYTVTVTGGPVELTISGYIKTGQGIAMPDVPVTATNGGSSDMTDSSGFYEVTVPNPWTGQVNPIKDLWSFSPALWGFVDLNHDVTDANFTGTYLANPTPKISGYVRTGGGAAIEDVLVSADSGESDTTDSSGYYEFTVSTGPVPEPWNGIVTPSKGSWEFDPAATAYFNLSSDIADQNYNGTYTGDLPTISGYLRTSEGAGIEDVLVLAYNGGGTDTTDADGFYGVTVPALWSGVVIPSKGNWTFDPAHMSYTDVITDIPDQNYVGTYFGENLRAYRYKIIDLYTIGDNGVPGYNVSNAYGINDSGQVVGWASTAVSAISKAFFWEDVNDNGQADPGEMINIDTIWGDFTNSFSTGINGAGRVVGWGGSISSSRAFLWEDLNDNGISDPGEMQELEELPLSIRSSASGCNNNSQAVGSCTTFDNTYACLWDLAADSVTSLGTLGGSSSVAAAINNAGQVVGNSRNLSEDVRAFLWTDGNGNGVSDPCEMIDLGTLGGDNGRAWGINNAGQVIGRSQNASGELRAFIWKDNNGNGISDPCEMQQLGTLGFGSWAHGINDAGQVVGEFYTIDGDFGSRRAFLWNENWGMVELYELLCNPSGWDYLTEARAINNYGQIAGQGYTVDGEYHAFLLIPLLAGDFDCDYNVDVNDLAIFCEQWLRPRLSADFIPPGGDGLVDFLDWVLFADAWQSIPSSSNWNPKCDIAPEEGSDIVDANDLAVFVDQWLGFSAYCADIDPAPLGNGIVNIYDFAVFAEHWHRGE